MAKAEGKSLVGQHSVVSTDKNELPGEYYFSSLSSTAASFGYNNPRCCFQITNRNSGDRSFIASGAILLALCNIASRITPQNAAPLGQTFANSLTFTGLSLFGLQLGFLKESTWQNLPYHIPTSIGFSLLIVVGGMVIKGNHDPAPFHPPLVSVNRR